MFESVDDLNKRLPRPDWTGRPIDDRRVVDQYIANGKRLRNEVFRCLGRALISALKGGLRRVTHAPGGMPSHQV